MWPAHHDQPPMVCGRCKKALQMCPRCTRRTLELEYVYVTRTRPIDGEHIYSIRVRRPGRVEVDVGYNEPV